MRKLNIDDLKEMVKECVYEEENVVCMNDQYYNRLLKTIDDLQSKVNRSIECIEKDIRWFDSEYASVYGELCSCPGVNNTRLEVMPNPSNALNILKEEEI